jgi:hypothetical protein
MGFMFSSTWPTFYAQMTRHLGRHRNAMAYGANLGSQSGLALCFLASSAIADVNLTASMFFGPCVLWGFGAMYFATRLSRMPAAT